jgi:O-succinylhomoserine sulfhydrylase
MDNKWEGYHFDTLAVRAGTLRSEQGEHSEAIFATSSYIFENSAQAAARFSGEEKGNVYSRYTNPTVRMFEERMAALEGAEQAVATASGMAAILSTCMALLESGDHIVCSRSVFGTTTTLFNRYMKKFGVSVTFVSLTDMAGWKKSLNPKTKFLFVETPSNPLGEVVDLKQLSELAHANGSLLVVDNCFCTPALQQPLKLGADIIIHSATKYIDGQGRCLGGVVLGSSKWMEEVLVFLRTAGPTLSPFNAWVFLKGLETLRLRMEAHSANALALAQWLEKQKGIEKVFYGGLPSHEGHVLASQQQRAYGGVLSFRVMGGKAEAWRFMDAVKLMSLTANLGDAKTTIIHPATTTHSRLTPEERLASGITDNLIRVAVGLEDIADLKADLQRGLSAL